MKVKTQEKIAIFPGTFDPPTLGHLDVIERGRHLFDRLIVAIGVNSDKTELFPVALRQQLLEELTRDWANTTVEAYTGLTVDLVKKRSAVAILRGLRNMTDLEYEFQLALTNRAIASVDTVFIMTNERFGFTSSSLIRQIAALGGDLNKLTTLLPDRVIKELERLRPKPGQERL
ncbi:MAG: pantetheine-phosphate adenylyltransferase [Phycisphaerae bacterium]